MPRRRNETNQQWMERLRKVREVMDDPKYMMRVQASREYLNRTQGSNQAQEKRRELIAFMSLFHPDVPQDEVMKMARETT
jgi:hypothetical protein